jgi:hypothetical protein
VLTIEPRMVTLFKLIVQSHHNKSLSGVRYNRTSLSISVPLKHMCMSKKSTHNSATYLTLGRTPSTITEVKGSSENLTPHIFVVSSCQVMGPYTLTLGSLTDI